MKATTKEEAERAWAEKAAKLCERYAGHPLVTTTILIKFKSALHAEIEDRLKLLFLAIEDGGKEYYPFDSMSEENLIGMKRAYQDLFGIIETTLPPKE